jgi:hypothetical protein
VLHSPPQALDEDVVMAAPASVHADRDPMIRQHLGELIAGELRALISIEDAGLAEPGESLAQCLERPVLEFFTLTRACVRVRVKNSSDRFAGQVEVSRLVQGLAPYRPEHWFSNESSQQSS